MERWLPTDEADYDDTVAEVFQPVARFLHEHRGTSDEHSASVSVPWADGRGHTSYRVTPAIAQRARQRLKRLRA